jgi:hypothetical protein
MCEGDAMLVARKRLLLPQIEHVLEFLGEAFFAAIAVILVAASLLPLYYYLM